MPSTFLELTNMLLRRLNEVEIQAADFTSVRGVQALAKDAIRASIARINSAEFEWPFNAAEHVETLVPGEEEYSWPSYLKTVEWNSFQLLGSTSLGVRTQKLRYVDRDVWYSKMRSTDHEAGAAGISAPEYVFPSHGNGYGVSPSPDKAYSISFRYFMTYADLQATGDETRVPTIYDHVIIDGGLYHMYMFRDNPDQANIAMAQFMLGIKEMQTVLINRYESIRDTRVNF